MASRLPLPRLFGARCARPPSRSWSPCCPPPNTHTHTRRRPASWHGAPASCRPRRGCGMQRGGTPMPWPAWRKTHGACAPALRVWALPGWLGARSAWGRSLPPARLVCLGAARCANLCDCTVRGSRPGSLRLARVISVFCDQTPEKMGSLLNHARPACTRWKPCGAMLIESLLDLAPRQAPCGPFQVCARRAGRCRAAAGAARRLCSGSPAPDATAAGAGRTGSDRGVRAVGRRAAAALDGPQAD